MWFDSVWSVVAFCRESVLTRTFLFNRFSFSQHFTEPTRNLPIKKTCVPEKFRKMNKWKIASNPKTVTISTGNTSKNSSEWGKSDLTPQKDRILRIDWNSNGKSSAWVMKVSKFDRLDKTNGQTMIATHTRLGGNDGKWYVTLSEMTLFSLSGRMCHLRSLVNQH